MCSRAFFGRVILLGFVGSSIVEIVQSCRDYLKEDKNSVLCLNN